MNRPAPSMDDKNANASRSLFLNPVVLKLGLISFFGDVASEMLYPITPIFLTTVVGASVMSLGVIEGFAEGIASLLKTYFGRISDRTGNRRTFIWTGYLLAAFSKPLIGISTSWVHVFGARGLDRVGKGVRTAPRDALLAEAVESSQRGLAFGFHRAMDSFGAFVGPLLAILFIQQSQAPEHLRSIYMYAFLPALASAAIAFSIREPAKRIKKAETPPSSGSGVLIGSSFKTYLFAWGIFSIANSSDAFLLLKAQKSGLSLTATIVLYAFYNLIYAATSPFLGHLSDRLSRRSVLIFGLFIFGWVYLGFGFANEPWQYWLLFAVYGLYMGATDGVGKAYAVDLVPAHLRATGLGVLGTVTGLTTILASSIAGVLWDQAGPLWTFIYGASGAFLAILILIFVPAKPQL